jgi:LCP family protein required for cell wall assembly
MSNSSNKHPKNRRPVNSIDGVSHAKQPSAHFEGSNFRRPASHRPRRQIDDFSSQQKFRSKNSGIVPTPLNNDFREGKQDGLFDRNVATVQMDGTKRKRKHSRRGRAFKIFAVLTILVLLAGGFLFAKGYINLRKVLDGSGGAAALQQNVDPSLLKGEGDGRINIVVSGRGGPAHEAPDLTDTIIVASIDPLAKEAGLVSIPRDFYVEVPDYGSMKINQVFYTGKYAYLNTHEGTGQEKNKRAEEAGLKLLDDVVAEVLGIPVHYHAIVDFTGFKKAVDTVGGVDLNVPAPLQENMRINGQPYRLDVKRGQQHFDGFEALAYSRSRFTSPRGDFDRSERQRLIILALKEKILSLGTYSNPVKVSGLLDDLGGHIKTNFGVDDIKQMHQISGAIGSGRVISVGLLDAPNNYITTGMVGGLSVVLPSAGLGNYEEVHRYVHSVLIDSFIRQENPSVVVLNGTQTPGAATEKADELKSYGYNVVRIDNASKRNYNRNILIDLKGGENKYTKRYLELRMNTYAVDSLPGESIEPPDADFVIIVGE